MYRLDTTPTTGSDMNSGLVTGLTGGPETTSVPDVELKSTVEPRAAATFLKPRAIAVRSVSATSTAESDLGNRPAMSVISGDASRGGSETSAPAGPTTGEGEAASTLKVPVMATWPHAARTCGCRLRVASVPALKPLASPTG